MYSKGNKVDPQGLKALLKFDPFVSGRYEAESQGGLTATELAQAIDNGMIFSPNVQSFSHDDAVKKMLTAKKSALKAPHHADLFVASLSLKRLDYRVGLPALAIASHFPDHPFKPLDGGSYCAVCGLKSSGNDLLRTERNFDRFAAGGVIGTSPLDIAFYLECHQLLEPVTPTAADIKILHDILAVLSNAEPDETAKKQVLSKVRKVPGFKANAEQAQLLLETLGYCGVLASPEHPGLLTEYINLGYAPRTSAKTDWRYPTDFWRGEFGVNKKALDYWFSHLALGDI